MKAKAVESHGIIPEDCQAVQFKPAHDHRRLNRHNGTPQVRPPEGNYMAIRAEMNLLVALGAGPDLAVGGKPVEGMIYQP
jgi:hypothetical protein